MSNDETVALMNDSVRGEELIELEAAAPSNVDKAARSQHVALVFGQLPSIGTETTSLLQSRLRTVSTIIVIVSAATLLWALVNQFQDASNSLAVVRNGALARLLFGVGLLGWLFSKHDFKPSSLRLVEYAIFGFLTLTWIYVRYGRIVVDASEGPTQLAVSGRESLIALFAWMVLHGIFIPHHWRETAKVVLTMSLAPVVVLVLVQILRADLFVQLDEITSLRNLTLTILVVSVAAMLSIYASGVLNALREEVHAAKRYGQYQLLSRIGAGGMGEVYRAEHALMKRPCALKLIRPDAAQDPLALARFEREVRATSSLTHPNTISIFDYGHADDGTFYYVMELLPGMSLADLIALGPLPAGRTIYLLRQVCSGLAEAHQAGLIHRDLKPANIFVSERGGMCDFVKVLDFGLVKLTNTSQGGELTMDQAVSGTPSYMAPEQALADSGIDARSDLYSLGSVAYHMLTGRPPFVDESSIKVLIDHARSEVVPPSQLVPGIPPDLEQVVLRCLEKSPDQRFHGAIVLEQALAACESVGEWDATKAAIWWQKQLLHSGSEVA